MTTKPKSKAKPIEKNNQSNVQETGDFLTKNEVATILRLSTKTIDRYLKQGLLNYFKIGRHIRISSDDFRNFVQKHRFSSSAAGSIEAVPLQPQERKPALLKSNP